MNRTLLASVVVIAAAFVLSAAWAADKNPTSGSEPTTIIKFLSSGKDNWSGTHVMVINGTMADGDKPITLIVPNKNPMKSEYNPPDFVVKLIDAAKAGDYFQVSYHEYSGKHTLNMIGAYKYKEGEEEPGAIVFTQAGSQKVGDQDYTTAEGTRFKKPFVFLVPLVKGADGKQAADAEIETAVKAFKKGDVVVVQAENRGSDSFIKDIYAYKPPMLGEIGPITEQTVGEQKYQGFPLNTGGKSLTVLVPNVEKSKPNAALLAKAKAIKPGADVEVKARDKDGQLLMIDIRAVPKTAPAKAGK